MRAELRDFESSTREADRLAREGRLASARRMLAGVLREAPDFVPALEVLARVCWYAHDHEGTRRVVRRLLRLNPHEPGYRILDALAAVQMGDLAGADRALDLAEIQAADAGSRRQIAEIRAALEHHAAEAVAYWRAHHPPFAEWFDRDPFAAAAWLGLPGGRAEDAAAIPPPPLAYAVVRLN